MQTDLMNQRLHGAFANMFNTFSDEESRDMGIHTFKFGPEDIMRSRLCKYIITKLDKDQPTD